jgi:hypothetical protein
LLAAGTERVDKIWRIFKLERKMYILYLQRVSNLVKLELLQIVDATF